MKTIRAVSFVVFILSLLLGASANAKQFPKIVTPISGPSILSVFSNPAAPYVKSRSIPYFVPVTSGTINRISMYQNTVELRFKNHSALDVDANVTVEAEVTYYPVDGSSSVVKNVTLTVDYHVAAQQKNKIKDIFAFRNAYRIDVKITNVSILPAPSAQVQAKLANFLEMEIGFQEERITRIPYSVVPVLTHCTDQKTDELVLQWGSVPDAEEYELEYTFVDDYDVNYGSLNANSLEYNFKDNSTRVSLAHTYYRFPLLVEKGWILYRIRAVGRGGPNLDIPVRCMWSGGVNSTSGTVSNFPNKYYHATAHCKDHLNWQVSVTFAEEGKRSDVIKYMDGTFRTRQTVTGVNLDRVFPVSNSLSTIGLSTSPSTSCYPGSEKQREVIASEVIYDYQGRPAVNVLPTPINFPKIEFIGRLNNKNTSSWTPYTWREFDSPNFMCRTPEPLSKDLQSGVMGAAAYYSPNNPVKIGFNAFIPDAKQYPFTQISYLQDNTGRIAAQSGVGPTFQFQKDHETRFYYAAPNQQELDRMFGTEVGDAARYKKNAVMDPNRQISVTYINPEGKTVATSLAGKKPVGLEPVGNQDPIQINVPLISKNVLDSADKTLITEHNFFVSSDNTDYTFTYSLDREWLDAQICNGDVCLDCIYDLSIRLSHVESCTGELIVHDSFTIGNLLNQDTVDLVCNTNMNGQLFNWSKIKNLNIGTYVLTKKLTVNKAAADAYVARVFRDTCKAKWDELLAGEMAKADTLDCYSSCDTCLEPPVQSDDPVCDTMYCKPSPNRCDVIRAQMRADVSPGGQYGKFDRNSLGVVSTGAYPLSVYNPNGFLPDNTIDFALFPADFQTAIAAMSTPNKIQYLITNWRPEYADHLIFQHPEHCQLGWCNQPGVDSSLDFDMKLLSTVYHHDAVTNGYLDPTSSLTPYEQLLNADPWFHDDGDPAVKPFLLAKLQQYGCGGTQPIDQLAMHMAYCANHPTGQWQPGTTPQMDPNGPPCTIPPEDVHGFGLVTTNGPNGALNDLEWTYLRALYIAAKNSIIQQSMTIYASDKYCNVLCIGNSEYYRWWPFLSQNTNSAFSYNPCSHPSTPWAWMLYQDKQSRFSTGMGNILGQLADQGVSIDLSTVQDFNDPCQIAGAIQTQSQSINQQLLISLCGGDTTSGVDCPTALTLTELLNSMLASGQATTFNIPSSLRSNWLNSLEARRTLDGINVKLMPCDAAFSIPYKPVDLSQAQYISVSSIEGISNVVCQTSGNHTFCTFDITVKYADGTDSVVRRQMDCPILAPCVDTTECIQPSPLLASIKGYLNHIFQHSMLQNGMPTSTELLSWLPPALFNRGEKHAVSVALTTSPNFNLFIRYSASGMWTDSCVVTIFPLNPYQWSDVRTILSMTPDPAVSANAFLIKAMVEDGDDQRVIELKGTTGCWPMIQCPPAITLCDTIPDLPDPPYHNECVDRILARAKANAHILYGQWVDSMKNALLAQYYAKCLESIETLDMEYKDYEYHYTLYYYDQAGNLVKTVPPSGVNHLAPSQLAAVTASRLNQYATPVLPQHVKQTVYRYNTLNQCVWQKTPDAGESTFLYDGLGRIVASQNAQQKHDGDFYSYAKYDKNGRLVEGGKLKSNALTPSLVRNFAGWKAFIEGLTTRTEITLTQYDKPYTTAINGKFGTSGQRNLRQRVASIFNFPTYASLPNGYTHATHYTYDIGGNVYKLIQDYPNGIIGDKSIEYDYDLQSGKVNSVSYQKGKVDQFLHRYKYDAANRLTKVQTSGNGLIWENDANYLYYGHGPLARIEIGTDKVQGLDYMYTLQGWIKGVNGVTLSPAIDVGRDGIADPNAQVISAGGIGMTIFSYASLFGNAFNGPGYGTMHNPFANDAYGYILDYYGKTDYEPIVATTCLDAFYPSSQVGNVYPLYNGNISRMYTQVQTIGNNGFTYIYDQLHRLKEHQAWKLDAAQASLPMSLLPGDAYGGNLTYDADGNILTMLRNGASTSPAVPQMDKLNYWYYKQNGSSVYNPGSGIPSDATNRLAYVEDAMPAGNYPLTGDPVEDIDNQQPQNYSYDRIGNLIKDNSALITSIGWNLQNKITNIVKSAGLNLAFSYDAMGNRVEKHVTGSQASDEVRTFYVRDAQGNTMATYSYKLPFNAATNTYGSAKKLFWNEAHIYGSSRLGLFQPDTIIPAAVLSSGQTTPVPTPTPVVGPSTGLYNGIIYQQLQPFTVKPKFGSDNAYFSATRGYKQYELSNHLGNVLATITDRKLPTTTNGAVSYTADQSTGQDYYGFGMLMPKRDFTASKNYRYGFNGKENDNDVKGEGNQQDYGMRIYDPRIGKFLSLDPLSSSYPELTPYQFSSNRPLDGIDLDGTEHLNSDEARIEVTAGGIMLKIENMTPITRAAWRRAELDMNNWTTSENGHKDVGISRKIDNFDVITSPVSPEAEDVEETPSSLKSQEKYLPDPASRDYNGKGKGSVSRKYHSTRVPISSSRGGGLAKGANTVMALVGLYQWVEEQTWAYDMGQIEWDEIALNISKMEVNAGIRLGLVPPEYQTQASLAAITNVVLQGVNKTSDPKISEIGMKIYNTFNSAKKAEE